MPSRSQRLAAAVAIACLTAALVWAGSSTRAALDFDYVYLAGHAVAAGQDPYQALQRAVETGVVERPLYYPATAAVLLAPFGALPPRVALAAFLALGFGCLAYGLTRGGWWRLLILVSAPAIHTVLFGQWAVWLLVGVGLPWLAFVWAAKPSLGLALFAGWPSRWALLGGLALTALTTILVGPHWPGDWLAILRYAGIYYVAPVQRPFGILLLLAFVAWRRPEGRMLGALALIPHTTSLPDVLYLLLIPRTARELGWLIALGYLASTLLTLHTYQRLEPATMLVEQWPAMLTLTYLPALALLLWHEWTDRHPMTPMTRNVGAPPAELAKSPYLGPR